METLLPMRDVAMVLFALTWCFIAFRRLPVLPIGRAAGTLLGAVLMVVFGVLRPEEAYGAIDHNTIALLLGMMLLSHYLTQGGAFELLAARVIQKARTPWRLLVGLSLLSALLSAFLVNDTVCVFLTPVVVSTCLRAGLPLGPFLIALATSANIGSAATLVGNPQNMIIGSMSGISFTGFLLRSLPGVALAMFAQIKLLELFYRRKLPTTLGLEPSPAARYRPGLALWVTGGLIVAFLLGLHMGFSTLAGVLILILAERKEPREAFEKVDWTLLLFFASLFVVVQGLHSTGLVETLFEQTRGSFDLGSLQGQGLFTGVMVLGSNLVSNVPMVLLAGPVVQGMADPELAWVELAFVSTIAGNLTLVGSVANLIVAERAKGAYNLGFFEYLRFGAVTTLASLAVGIPGILITNWVFSL